MEYIHDFLGIGFGPSNIALAIALEELYPNRTALFLEKKAESLWQEEMLFENSLDIHSNIQNIPHRDLVTPRNPRSRYTFMNYLHENGRLFEHLNMDMLMPLRPEYAGYIRWVANFFSDCVRFGQSVESIAPQRDGSSPSHFKITSHDGATYRARHLAVGTGRRAFIPDRFRPLLGAQVFHASAFNSSWRDLARRQPKKIAIVGSSQSAVEIILYLSKVAPELHIHSIFRRFAVPLKDTSPFMSEVFFPAFIDAFYSADPRTRRRIEDDVRRTNYGCADSDVLCELYRQIYYDKLAGRNRITLQSMTEITGATVMDSMPTLMLHNVLTQEIKQEAFDAVVLATGFDNFRPENGVSGLPAILNGVAGCFASNEQDHLVVGSNYDLMLDAPWRFELGKVYLNGLCEWTHGMGDAGSLSLVSVRAERILRSAFDHAFDDAALKPLTVEQAPPLLRSVQ